MGDKPKRSTLERVRCRICNMHRDDLVECREPPEVCNEGWLPDPPKYPRGKIPKIINYKAIAKRIAEIQAQKTKEEK